MAQTSWLRATAGAFNFFTDADAALISYFQTVAPNGIAAVLAAVSITRDVLTDPLIDESKSGFVQVNLWTTSASEAYFSPPSAMAEFTTRCIVWALHTDADTMLQSCQDICGALAAGFQQTKDTTGNDWADWYVRKHLPTASIDSITLELSGDDRALARGEVTCKWTHDE
jgi:hypothetical protein